MRLPAESPAAWTVRNRATLFPDHHATPDQPTTDQLAGGDGPAYVLRTTEDLITGALDRALDDLTAGGAPLSAAGMQLAGAYAGLVSWWLGVALLGADAALVVSPSAVSYWCHPDGYPDALEIADPIGAVVPPGHRWSDHPGVGVAPPRQVAEAAAHAAIVAVTPVVNRLHELTRAGRVGLWHEVADAFAGAAAYQQDVRITAPDLQTIDDALALPGAPWRRRPGLHLHRAPDGPVCVLHKAGCCLAYTAPTSLDTEIDEDHRAFEAAFPPESGRPDYCVSCKFRSLEETTRMQLWWRAREAAVTSSGSPTP